MTSNPQIEPKLAKRTASQASSSDGSLSERLFSLLSGFSIREIARRTGYNNETTRRYLRGGSSPPADFVARACEAFDLDAYEALNVRRVFREQDMRMISTGLLLAELTQRICRIEDCAVASVMVGDMPIDDELDLELDTHKPDAKGEVA